MEVKRVRLLDTTNSCGFNLKTIHQNPSSYTGLQHLTLTESIAPNIDLRFGNINSNYSMSIDAQCLGQLMLNVFLSTRQKRKAMQSAGIAAAKMSIRLSDCRSVSVCLFEHF